MTMKSFIVIITVHCVRALCLVLCHYLRAAYIHFHNKGGREAVQQFGPCAKVHTLQLIQHTRGCNVKSDRTG